VTPPVSTQDKPCAWDGCERPVETRGYCATHYRRKLHTGRYGYRDGATAREHVAELRKLGWTWEAIAEASGLSTWVAHNLHRGVTRRLLAESEAALLSVPLVPRESHRGIDATGTRRRVRALAWMGWPCWMVEDRVGCARRTLTRELSAGRVSVRLAQRVAAVYEELSTIPGPSRVAAGKARGLGFASPWAWDDIDNPRERPKGVAA
jgi:hypothetical protein